MWQMIAEFIFGVALFVNAALFIPQIILLLRKKHAEDVSLTTFLGFCIIQFFTILHGYYANDYLLMIGYIASLGTCGFTVGLIMFYRLRGSR